jgi:hypothetical protein
MALSLAAQIHLATDLMMRGHLTGDEYLEVLNGSGMPVLEATLERMSTPATAKVAP